jgi:hypothetical protein
VADAESRGVIGKYFPGDLHAIVHRIASFPCLMSTRCSFCNTSRLIPRRAAAYESFSCKPEVHRQGCQIQRRGNSCASLQVGTK